MAHAGSVKAQFSRDEKMVETWWRFIYVSSWAMSPECFYGPDSSTAFYAVLQQDKRMYLRSAQDYKLAGKMMRMRK